jgi:vacuolar protein sorting-associated protein 72
MTSVCKLINRMRELLMKAQQEDEEELFKEVEDDEDFSAPRM